MCVPAIRNSKLFAIVLLFFCVSCYKKGNTIKPAASSTSDSVNVSNVTYTNYVHALLKNNCSSCHAATGSAAAFWINTNTYDNASEYGVRIKETMVEGSMPPPPRIPFSQADKDLITAWIKRGLPE